MGNGSPGVDFGLLGSIFGLLGSIFGLLGSVLHPLSGPLDRDLGSGREKGGCSDQFLRKAGIWLVRGKVHSSPPFLRSPRSRTGKISVGPTEDRHGVWGAETPAHFQTPYNVTKFERTEWVWRHCRSYLLKISPF